MLFVRNSCRVSLLGNRLKVCKLLPVEIKLNSFSTLTTATKDEHIVYDNMIYEGRYWKSLRRIKRVSLGSCITGLIIVVSYIVIVILI